MLLYKYPLYDSNKNTWAMILFFSLFIPVFLGIFEPFGISELNGPFKPLILLGYSIFTFLAMSFYLFIVKQWFNEEDWNVAKEITFTLCLILTIGLLNYLYSARVFGFDGFDVKSLFVFVGYTIAVGIMPIGLMVLVRQNLLNRVYARSATEINKRAKYRSTELSPGGSSMLTISIEDNDALEMNLDDILFLESKGNHAFINAWRHGKQVTYKLSENLSEIEKQLSNEEQFCQIHRAFIVNLKHVRNVKGDAQGLKLTFHQINVQVPISRTLLHAFEEAYFL